MFFRLTRCFLCLAIGVSLLLVQPVVFAQTDRDALISLYNSTGGDSWSGNSGWKGAPTLEDGFNSDPCAAPLWFGVTCQGDRVTELDLDTNQLMGQIPSELGSVSNLTYLILDTNQLTGAIPEELGNLTNLEFLYLYDNELTGEIPSELSSLSNLTHLIPHSPYAARNLLPLIDATIYK